jgi:3-phosphoshikimate 1-carboxyvinyltransferase
MKIKPAAYLRGTVKLPGDKSISHRAAILAAIAEGQTRIENFSTAEDCRTTLLCLERLGVSIRQDGDTVFIEGVGKGGLQKPEKPLDCGNSGTTMRLLAGILVAQPFDSVLIGDESLSKRPMARIVSPLSQMGAEIEAENAHAPICIRGGKTLRGIHYEASVASAQVKSCVLFAGLFADAKTTVREHPPTRDHTERMLRWFGVDVDVDIAGTSVRRSHLTGTAIDIPCDLSAASFFIVAAACLKDSSIVIPNVGLNPTRTALLKVMEDLGTNFRFAIEKEMSNETVGSIDVRGDIGRRNSKLCLRGDAIPKLIDEIPVLAVLGTQIDGGIEIRDAGELRHKESDRIAAIIDDLSRMNAAIEEFPDGFRVERSDLKGAVVDSFGDHRIAMAMAVACLLAKGETEIKDAECVDVSFPGFFETLEEITFR